MSKRWKPGLNGVFWYINSGNKIDYTTNNGFGVDEEKIAAGNCFFTKAEAKAAAEKVKALLLSLHDNSETLQPDIQEKQLPEWCKVGEWVWCIDSEKYAKIKSIDNNGTLYFNDDKYHNVYARPARLRPYNADEMRGLVGKMIATKEDCAIVTGYR